MIIAIPTGNTVYALQFYRWNHQRGNAALSKSEKTIQTAVEITGL
jgi:hypothetical protein